MNNSPEKQLNLYGLKKNFNELVYLYDQKKLPNKILLSGQKGIGKCTLAYHLVNYILSKEEDFSYNLDQNIINEKNRSFKLIQNKSSLNFILIDILSGKKKIDISQIRDLISNLNKSSLNTKPRLILIDNIQYLNINAVNALLKVIEEPNENIFFILINSTNNLVPTLKSRCLDFKISLSNNNSIDICNKLLQKNISDLINKELLDYYISPGKIINLIKFSEENSIDLKEIELKEFLLLIIEKGYHKKDDSIKNIFYELFELFLINNISLQYQNFYHDFIYQFNDMKKYNLDDEILLMKIKKEILNG